MDNRRVANSTKGSEDSLNSYTVYKDSDFQNFIGSISLYAHNILMDKLINDVRFLEQHNIMDYSLYVKRCKPTADSSPFLFHSDKFSYYIGIIDFL